MTQQNILKNVLTKLLKTKKAASKPTKKQIQQSIVSKVIKLYDTKLQSLSSFSMVGTLGCEYESYSKLTRVDQKCLSYNFHIRKKAYPTFSYSFMDSEIAEKNSSISIFS